MISEYWLAVGILFTKNSSSSSVHVNEEMLENFECFAKQSDALYSLDIRLMQRLSNSQKKNIRACVVNAE